MTLEFWEGVGRAHGFCDGFKDRRTTTHTGRGRPPGSKPETLTMIAWGLALADEIAGVQDTPEAGWEDAVINGYVKGFREGSKHYRK